MNIELLLKQIREDQEIKELKIKKEEYKVQAFADDLVFIIEDPMHTGIKLIKKIEEFGKVSGLKMNKEKTKIITKTYRIKGKGNWKRN